MSANKKIVIACQTCGYLLKDIANAYSLAGYDVTVMTSPSSQNIINSDLQKGIKLTSVISYDKSSSLKRILTWLVSAIQMWLKIGVSHKGSFVLFVSNPPLATLLPLLLRNTFSLLIWDIYPDVLVNQHVVSDGNFITKWWRRSNKKVYNRATQVFTISEGMKNCLSAYVDEKKINVVPLWPDNTNLHYIEKENNQFIKDNHLDEKFIVMYSGNLGNTHRMDVLVDVAKKFNEGDVVFILIGEGGKKKMIEQRVKDEGVNNVLLLPYQPYEFLSHSLSAADIAVVTLDTESSAMSVPSKTFNMMMLGKPLVCIASIESELGNIVRKYQVGEMFLPEDVEGITNFVFKLKNDDVARKQYMKNSLNASKEFSIENAKRFVD